MANFWKNIFGTGVENEGYDSADDEIDFSSSAVTRAEADYAIERSDSRKAPKAMNMMPLSLDYKIRIIEPTVLNDNLRVDIVDFLKEGYTLVLNLEKINGNDRLRIMDFTAGIAAALDGRIKLSSSCSYIIVPKNVEVISELKMEDDEMPVFNYPDNNSYPLDF